MSQRAVSEDTLLDAAKACVLASGVRRTTMSDVARRAGVSRMTLYRRHPDLTSVLQALMTREFVGIVADAEAAAAELPSGRERLVAAAVDGVARLVRHPLFARIVELDPELLLPYLTQRLGAFQQAVVASFERRVAEGVADGSIASRDAARVARQLELALRGFVLHAEAADLDELRRLLDRYLAP